MRERKRRTIFPIKEKEEEEEEARVVSTSFACVSQSVGA
jgi:hypothetical protein